MHSHVPYARSCVVSQHLSTSQVIFFCAPYVRTCTQRRNHHVPVWVVPFPSWCLVSRLTLATVCWFTMVTWRLRIHGCYAVSNLYSGVDTKCFAGDHVWRLCVEQLIALFSKSSSWCFLTTHYCRQTLQCWSEDAPSLVLTMQVEAAVLLILLQVQGWSCCTWTQRSAVGDQLSKGKQFNQKSSQLDLYIFGCFGSVVASFTFLESCRPSSHTPASSVLSFAHSGLDYGLSSYFC